MPVKPFILLVALIIVATGCKKKEPVIAISPPTQPTLSYVSYTGALCMGHTVCFTSDAKNAKTYLWDFGDGKTSTDSTPCHIYSDTGNFTVQLTLNNDTSINKKLVLQTYPEPLYTNLLNGTKTYRHIWGARYSGGGDDTTVGPDVPLTITYIDPLTIAIGSIKMSYDYIPSGGDSILYFYSSTGYNNTGQGTSYGLSFHHGVVDSITYSINSRISAGGSTFHYYYCP